MFANEKRDRKGNIVTTGAERDIEVGYKSLSQRLGYKVPGTSCENMAHLRKSMALDPSEMYKPTGQKKKQPAVVSFDDTTCKQHKCPATQFCFNCCQFCCDQCMEKPSKHPSHDAEDTDSALCRVTSSCNQLKITLSDKEAQLKVSKLKLKKKVLDKYEESRADIQKSVKDIQAQLIQWEKAAIGNLEQKKQKSLRELDMHQADTGKAIAEMTKKNSRLLDQANKKELTVLKNFAERDAKKQMATLGNKMQEMEALADMQTDDASLTKITTFKVFGPR